MENTDLIFSLVAVVYVLVLSSTCGNCSREIYVFSRPKRELFEMSFFVQRGAKINLEEVSTQIRNLGFCKIEILRKFLR
jgi:hypothetical protein